MGRHFIQISTDTTARPMDTSVLPDFDHPAMQCAPNIGGLWLMTMKFLERYESDFLHTLSEEELLRQSRFQHARDRSRYALSHGALRRILGRTLNTDPAALQFTTGPSGKPALIGHALEFNLSHTANWVAVACATTGSVGVDIEEEGRDIRALEIAQHSFHPNEAARLAREPSPQQLPLFLQWWTAKEATLKAWGESIFTGIATLDFSDWDSGHSATLLSEGGTLWTARRFKKDTIYGTLVTAATIPAVTLRVGLA